MRTPFPAIVAAVVVAAGLAPAADVPVHGRRLRLQASQVDPAKRSAGVALRDPAIAPPFPDPTLGATFTVSGGAGPGQCFAEVALDPAGWQPVGADGAQRGWRYRSTAPGTLGVRKALIRPGKVNVNARGIDWPCGLSANAERVPVSAVFRVGGNRYCGAFGGAVARNTVGRFLAREAPAPAACPETDLTVANLNFLHGVFCPSFPDSCRLEDRVDLLFQWIAASGCPDIVTLQEIWSLSKPFIDAHLATACPFAYETVYVQHDVDDELILSRYPVATSQNMVLHAGLGIRAVLHARLDHPLGPIDVFSTHLPSGGDGAGAPCTSPTCPQSCLDAGATTTRECQGVQVAEFVAAQHTVSTPAVVTGDFNEEPGSFVYNHLIAQGWTDTYLVAGNPECSPGTGAGCTSGRIDNALTDLESPASNETERIDYVFLVPPGPGALCNVTLDPAADGDGDGTATRTFADTPNPFAGTCGPLPDPICWPSDHEGAELDLNCG